MTVDTATAYAATAAITRSCARNFSWGIRLLDPPRRDALSAVYAFARRVDDVGDGDLPDPDKRAGLTELRSQLDRVRLGPGAAGDDAVLVALAHAAQRHPLPLDAFDDLIDGVEMDVAQTRYATWPELELYCRRVAGSIGRLSLAVFGGTDVAEADRLAEVLGVALQLTNILRDVREDLGNGRVYLPSADLDRFGVVLRLDEQGRLAGDAALDRLIGFEVKRNHALYAEGMRLLPLLDRRSRACCAAMAGIYLRLLQRIATQPQRIRSERVSLPVGEKLRVAGRSLAGLPV